MFNQNGDVMEKCCVKGTTEFKQLEELSTYLRIIADTNRLQILCLLKKGERCVCNIHEPLGLPQNLVSHHLKTLRDAGLVIARREGKWVHYRIDIGKLNYLTDLYNHVVLGGFDENQSIGTGMCKLQEARS
ncbi:MAG: metalloregulator ArsR/SmtB family transcription factor [Actinomycetota bacterium]|nr:metalloregulator ArsR/SmtB family transcription factor [Actinomycetota bacterium]